jgi:hypothetical protein
MNPQIPQVEAQISQQSVIKADEQQPIRRTLLTAIEQSILDEIDSNDDFATSALLAIFEAQTQYEQDYGITIDKNHVGFSAPDAKKLTYLARRAWSSRGLTKAGLEILRKRGKDGISRLGRYRKQIAALLERRVN